MQTDILGEEEQSGDIGCCTNSSRNQEPTDCLDKRAVLLNKFTEGRKGFHVCALVENKRRLISYAIVIEL